MINRDLNNCPCCGNHCKVKELMCDRGKKYFGKIETQSNTSDLPKHK